MTVQARFETHDIVNQSPPYEDVDLFASDRALRDAIEANGAGAEAAALSEFGRHWGTAAMFDAARVANENTPQLKTFDTKGFRRDVIEFHPAYHSFMEQFLALYQSLRLAAPDFATVKNVDHLLWRYREL